MIKKMRGLLSGCAIGIAALWGVPANAGLIGHDFTADYLFPTANNVFASLGTAVANTGPLGEFNFLGAIWIDLSDTQIAITFFLEPDIADVPFVGFRIRDVDGSAQITGLSLASVTNLPGFDAGNFSLSGNDILVNLVDGSVGLEATGLPTIVLNVATVTSVPEPGTLALLAAAGFGLMGRKRRNS